MRLRLNSTVLNTPLAENIEKHASPKVDLDLIKAPEVVSNKPDKLTREELEIQELAGNITARKRYARGIFILVISWITAVLVLLFFQGFQIYGFHLSDSVLLGALGSTTANIIGVLIIVIRYLFPSKKS